MTNRHGAASFSEIADRKVPPRVVACLSAPRLGFTDPLCIAAQFAMMGIELRKRSGAFWDQSLSRLLYDAIRDGFEYALVFDYDSVFKPIDVNYLVTLAVECPEADAIFPVQYRREADEIILRLDRNVYREPASFNQPLAGTHLAPATFGHFGLTLLKLSTLKNLPHPWFIGRPGSDGRWDADDKVDPDTYFWNHFVSHGLKPFNAWRCVIGHLQLMITWPDEDYKPLHQYVGKYFEDGDAPRRVLAGMSERAGYKKAG